MLKFGFIIESYWLENDYADRLKNHLLENTTIQILINFGKVKKIFEDADNDTCILIFSKIKADENKIKYINCNANFDVGNQQQNNQKLMSHIISQIKIDIFSDEYIEIYWIEQSTLGPSKWVLSKLTDILSKIEEGKTLLGELCNIGQGVVPGRKKEFKISSQESIGSGGGYWLSKDNDYLEVFNLKDNNSYRIELTSIKPLITNSGIKRFFVVPSNDFLIYTVPLQEKRENISKFPELLNYLTVYGEELKNRYDYLKPNKGGKYPWYGYQRIQNTALFENSLVKIICPYRAEQNRFAIDNVGYFGTTDMYAFVPKDSSSVDLYYLLGILNSKLLTFWYKEAGKSKGLILEFFATPLSKMPVFIAEDNNKNKLVQLSQKISELKMINFKFKETWYDISRKYRKGKISLEKLIMDDKLKVQNGEFNKVWISDISKFPDDLDEELLIEFNNFKISTKNEKTLQIYGLSGVQETLLLSLETSIQDFRNMIYLEIQLLLQSKKKVKSLKNILLKTEISVIKPNIWEKSFNLLRYTIAKFEKVIKTPFKNPAQLDSLIQEFENKLDALVFTMYNLSRSESETILNSLLTLKSIQKEILKRID